MGSGVMNFQEEKNGNAPRVQQDDGTFDPAPLMLQALAETRQYGLELAEACAQVSQSLREGGSRDGMDLLQQFLEGIGWVTEALHMTSVMQEEKGIQIDMSEMSSTLAPVVESLENKDYGLIADLMVYEVQPLLNRWCDELAKAGSPNGND